MSVADPRQQSTLTGTYADEVVMSLAHTDNHMQQRLTQSTPGSPQEHGRISSFEVIGSAESLVGRVSNKQLFLL